MLVYILLDRSSNQHCKDAVVSKSILVPHLLSVVTICETFVSENLAIFDENQIMQATKQ
jgi:ABC-type polysaccharide transport system permease subunit